jgi:hypothetical protein
MVKIRNKCRHVNRLDKIVSKNFHSNDILVSSRSSLLYCTKTDSGVDRTSEDVPEPLIFVHVHRTW